MTSADPERVERIFEQLQGLSPDERDSALNRLFEGDQALRDTVQRLLDASASTETLRAALTPIETEPAPGIARLGTRVGRYELEAVLGHGAFGVVFLARQAEPVRRQVALKLLQDDQPSQQVLARFEQERQALAHMSHPAIAQVYDAGTSDRGEPYLVMEYIAGDTLTAFCNAHSMNLEARLRLFARVCEGVQHAHLRGLIHRDLKPSNILVACADTNRPEHAIPKIIDFGVAKALTRAFTDTTIRTMVGLAVGTPQYMSPEQAGGSPDIDARTDIYALGVVLYQLATDHFPIEIDSSSFSTAAAIERLVLETEVNRPSALLASRSGESTAIAERRSTTPRRLHQMLKRDLDWVVMKALAKNRSDRYQTALELASDIQRLISGQTAQARSPHFTKSLIAILQEHWRIVLPGVVVGIVIIAGLLARFGGLFGLFVVILMIPLVQVTLYEGEQINNDQSLTISSRFHRLLVRFYPWPMVLIAAAACATGYLLGWISRGLAG